MLKRRVMVTGQVDFCILGWQVAQSFAAFAASSGQLWPDVGLKGQASQVGTTSASAFVADAVQVRTDGAHADIQLDCDLGVSAALGHQAEQLLFACAESGQARRCCRWRGLGTGDGESIGQYLLG